MSKEGYGEVRCRFCWNWQPALFQHADEESFLARAPWGGAQECSNMQCRQVIQADRDNIRWRRHGAATGPAGGTGVP